MSPRSNLSQGMSFKAARDRDPATSHSAADDIANALPNLRGVFFDVLGRAAEPMTAAEVGLAASKFNAESIRKRAHELVRLGVIVRAAPRPCRVTGKMATTYQIRRAK